MHYNNMHVLRVVSLVFVWSFKMRWAACWLIVWEVWHSSCFVWLGEC